MVDGLAFLGVLSGTLAVTLLQCGAADLRQTLFAIGGLFSRRLDPAQAKAELAHQIMQIRQDGLIRAEPRAIGDVEFDEATGALYATRSLDALLASHAEHRNYRLQVSERVRAVLHHASELAPVMGLGGTLLSLGQLASPAAAAQGVASAIGLAVTTTFYGLFVAHGVFMPLAGLIDRRAAAEDSAREDIFQWLDAQVRQVAPEAAHLPLRDAA